MTLKIRNRKVSKNIPLIIDLMTLLIGVKSMWGDFKSIKLTIMFAILRSLLEVKLKIKKELRVYNRQ